ncbi:MAG: TlpA disulfide reductase family protein [Pyrinomonadaceae bacterium]
MKKLLTNLALFAALSIALSGITSCTKTASTQNNSIVETAPNSNSNTNTTEAKNNDYPPVPSGILQNEIKDLDGNTFKLEDKKGKVVLVNLWATWCGPCLAEMPEIAAMYEKNKDRGFEVIGLDSDDESVDDVKKKAEELKVNYKLGFADGKMLSEFIKITRLQGIPQTIIINREGKMTFAVGGGGQRVVEKMKEAVEKTLSE